MDHQNDGSTEGVPKNNKKTALQRSLSTPRDDVAPAHTDASIRSKSFDHVRRSGSWHRRDSASSVPAGADVAPPAESSTVGVDVRTAAVAAQSDPRQYKRSDIPRDNHSLVLNDFVGTSGLTPSPGVNLHHSSSNTRPDDHAVSAATAAVNDAGSSSFEQQVVPDLLLAGEAVVPNPAPAAAENVIIHAVDQAPPAGLAADRTTSESNTSPHTAAAEQVEHVVAEAAAAAAATSLAAAGGNATKASTTGSIESAKQKPASAAHSSLSNSASSNSKSSGSGSSRQSNLPLPALIALAVAAAAAAAGAVVIWLKRRRQGSGAAAAAADDDEFTRALKEMDAEEKAFELEAAAEADPGAELSAEEAALAMQQADAARRAKMIASALEEGDAELAKIDALDSADLLENLDADELAALEAELAELEGADAEAPAGEAAAA